MFTIEDAKRVQRDLGFGHVHVAYIVPDKGFVMAHTDAERANQAEVPLTDCRYHYWLGKLPDAGWQPYLWGITEPGWYALEFGREAQGIAL